MGPAPLSLSLSPPLSLSLVAGGRESETVGGAVGSRDGDGDGDERRGGRDGGTIIVHVNCQPRGEAQPNLSDRTLSVHVV